MTERDPRATYRHLPPTADLADTTAEVEAPTDGDDDERLPDTNQGAAPYLRTTWGPWIR
ncbi:hypothetical protein [Mycolicibacterium palauense]|uniref:hypothetical protein n=1 Tax=Mycolicibacterium palauense TaxID=2034511 RepID=UPI00159BB686|nr:hypothetical protein [Mycolicibacterium palauense]